MLEEQEEKRINRTGIPDSLLQRAEAKSGYSFTDVRVQYNSPKPAAIGAYAYTQGSQVYIGPGQEHHLPHELGHVLQQKQGRVQQTTTVLGQPLNDDTRLEREADHFL